MACNYKINALKFDCVYDFCVPIINFVISIDSLDVHTFYKTFLCAIEITHVLINTCAYK